MSECTVPTASDCLLLGRTVLASWVEDYQLDDPRGQTARMREQVVVVVRNCKSVANPLVGN